MSKQCKLDTEFHNGIASYCPKCGAMMSPDGEIMGEPVMRLYQKIEQLTRELRSTEDELKEAHLMVKDGVRVPLTIQEKFNEMFITDDPED